MNRSKWRDLHGATPAGSDKSQICWFHLHQDGGCKLKDGQQCYNSHDHFPEAYKGKKFANLSMAEQSTIAEAVER